MNRTGGFRLLPTEMRTGTAARTHYCETVNRVRLSPILGTILFWTIIIALEFGVKTNYLARLAMYSMAFRETAVDRNAWKHSGGMPTT